MCVFTIFYYIFRWCSVFSFILCEMSGCWWNACRVALFLYFPHQPCHSITSSYKLCHIVHTRYAATLQGLATISSEVMALAEKAKQGKLQPHEFQVRPVSVIDPVTTITSVSVGFFAWLIMCGPRKLGHKNGSSPFPGWRLYNATKPQFSFMFIFCRVIFGFTGACHISVRFGLFLTMVSDELGRHKMGHSIEPGHRHWHLRLRHDLMMPVPNRRWPSQKRGKSKHNRRFV